MRLLLTFLLLVAACHSGFSAVLTTDGSLSDTQAKLNSSSSGDTIQIAAGSFTWSSALLNPLTKTVVICGSGNKGTTISQSGANELVDTSGAIAYPNVITYSNIVWGIGSAHEIMSFTGQGTNICFRVTYCKFNINASSSYHIIVPTSCFGLIDSNYFAMITTSGDIQCISPFGSGDGNDGGFTPWTRPLTLGTTNAVYVEGNTFDYNTTIAGVEDCIDAYGGARIVIRYNQFTNTTVGFHGCDSGNRRSMHSFEIYNNNYVNNSSAHLRAVTIRGGTGVIYNNTYSGSGATWNGLTYMYYRACPPLDQSAWGTCDGTHWKLQSSNLSANGSRIADASGTIGFSTTDNETLGTAGAGFANFLDGTSANGYPGRDQPGYTTGQVSTPIYAWNQGTLVGGTYDGGFPPSGGIEAWVQLNRDYFNNGSTPKPGYTALSYPHPLAGGSGGPSDPSITVQPSNQTVTAPSAATFSVAATGTAPVTYQWLKNGTPIGGATSSSVNTGATTTGNNGDVYAVQVTSAVGGPVQSVNATLTVNSGGGGGGSIGGSNYQIMGGIKINGSVRTK